MASDSLDFNRSVSPPCTHLEWRRSMQKLIRQDSQRPKVHVVPMRLSENHLWRKVIKCSAICLAAARRVAQQLGQSRHGLEVPTETMEIHTHRLLGACTLQPKSAIFSSPFKPDNSARGRSASAAKTPPYTVQNSPNRMFSGLMSR